MPIMHGTKNPKCFSSGLSKFFMEQYIASWPFTIVVVDVVMHVSIPILQFFLHFVTQIWGELENVVTLYNLSA